ncbi:hypothetical protein J4233_03150 [Candidatus Pacearchaeota archaeon]|nr:hypothetical protein [Candidatus Pacearchaeota archaeon]
MKIEDHNRNIRESLEVIHECIQKGIQERQRTIGFNASVAATEMLEVYLHKQNLINPGTILKHEWFTSERKAYEKLSFDFPEKEAIIKILVEIESKRNILCYGKPQPAEAITKILSLFNQLKIIFQEAGLSWN